MKVLLDACVLYPTVLREILLAVADEGIFTPLWSDRILEEWARAARKIGPTGEPQARAEIALARARYPDASVIPHDGTVARLWLPDPNDIHVLAAAIDGHADRLVTENLRDFPKGDLLAWDIVPESPDAFLYAQWLTRPEPVERAVARVHAEAQRLGGETMALRMLLRRVRLNRLAKAVG